MYLLIHLPTIRYQLSQDQKPAPFVNAAPVRIPKPVKSAVSKKRARSDANRSLTQHHDHRSSLQDGPDGASPARVRLRGPLATFKAQLHTGGHPADPSATP
ncbi:hypothetical protein PMIN06_009478 [Paraphaeosphaeria minitans]